MKRNSFKIDTAVSLAAPIITACGLLIGVWQFTNQQQTNDKLEFKRKIWEKRLEAYSQIGDIVAKIVIEKDDKKIIRYNQTFSELYWGKLPLFEDDSVEVKVKYFKSQVNDRMNHVVDKFAPNKLTEAGYDLVKTCQRSLKRSWGELNN